MCEDNVARFKCAAKHEERDEDPLRLVYIARCTPSRVGQLPTCAQRGRAHDTGNDNEDENCSECKGDTPPETP